MQSTSLSTRVVGGPAEPQWHRHLPVPLVLKCVCKPSLILGQLVSHWKKKSKDVQVDSGTQVNARM